MDLVDKHTKTLIQSVLFIFGVRVPPNSKNRSYGRYFLNLSYSLADEVRLKSTLKTVGANVFNVSVLRG